MEEIIEQQSVSPVPESVPVKNIFKVVPFVLIAIFFGAGLVFAGIEIGKKQIFPTSVSNTNATPKPIVSPSDETANWKTYTNEEYEFEIKYPSELAEYVSSIEKSFNIDYPGMSDVPLLSITYYQTSLVSEDWWNQSGKKEFPWLFNTAFNKMEIANGIKVTEVIGQRKTPGGATLSSRLLLISHNNVLFAVWGSSLIQDALFYECSNSYGQILSTFKFLN